MRVADRGGASVWCRPKRPARQILRDWLSQNEREVSDDTAPFTPRLRFGVGGRFGGAGPDPLGAGRRAVAPALLARHRAFASAQRLDEGLSRQGRGGIERQDQDRIVRERPALSRPRG